jgi:SulP family sulfate permease
MVIPQGVAYAALAGMPLVTGIYAALWPALVAVLFGASLRLSVGPTALTCLLVSASLQGMAVPGSAEWVSLAVWLALLSGLVQVGLGLLRGGWLLNLVNAPVLMAFTQAAALLIIASQLPDVWGLGRPLGTWMQAPTLPHLPALAFGMGSVALLLVIRRWKPAFPSVLVLVLGSAGLSWALGFEAAGGAVIGALPSGLPSLYVPSWPGWTVLEQLVLPALVISLVSFLEAASSAKVDNERLGRPWYQDQDLIGQGLGKLAAAVTGTFPTSASFSRSALFLFSGAQTGWASIASVLVVLAALVVLTPVLHHVPRAVLAAVVVVAVINMVQPMAFVRLWRLSRIEALTAGSTWLITLWAAPRLYWGVLVGVLMSLSHFLYQHLHPRIIEVGLHSDGSLRDRHLWHLPPLAAHTLALRMDANLDFTTAAAFERRIVNDLSAHRDTRHLVLFAQPINHIDATGVETLLKMLRQLQTQGIALHISGIKLPIEKVLEQAPGWPMGEACTAAGLYSYRTDAEALAVLTDLSKRSA